jgi:hypothetical protein
MKPTGKKNTMAKPAPTKKAAAKPAAKPAPKAAPAEESVFGVSDIVEIIKVRTGKETKTRDLRTLLRKMARDGRLDREIVAGNRERWTWTGPDDPEVETIIEAFENGELDADKKEKLDALKARKAKQRADKKAEEAAEDEADEDEESEDADDEDLDEE